MSVRYDEIEKELIESIRKEKNFWKRLSNIIALNELLKKTA